MKKILFTIILLFVITVPIITLATEYESDPKTKKTDPPKEVNLTNPLDAKQEAGQASRITPQILIGRVINAALGVVGSLALIMFVWGGLVWMTSSGSPEKITKGRLIVLWAAIGLVVVFSSYTLVRFILQRGLGVV